MQFYHWYIMSIFIINNGRVLVLKRTYIVSLKSPLKVTHEREKSKIWNDNLHSCKLSLYHLRVGFKTRPLHSCYPNNCSRFKIKDSNKHLTFSLKYFLYS